MKMGEHFTANNVFLTAALAVFSCMIIHFIYKILFAMMYNRIVDDDQSEQSDSSEEPVSQEVVVDPRPNAKGRKRMQWKPKPDFTHPWLLKNLKGHPGTVLHIDFSANGKFLAAACDDGSVMLWDIRDLRNNEHRTLRVNIDFDHASHVVWSPDTKAFLIHKVQNNNIVVYKIDKKKDGTVKSALEFMNYKKIHEDNVIGFGISNNGRFLMSCTSETDMIIWDLKGQPMERLDTYLVATYTAKISPCGRFVVAAGFTPEVKVLEVCFGKSGEFRQVRKAFDLTGHTSGVYDVAFDADTSHIATVSRDGTWKLYHTNIDYARGETPHVLTTGLYDQTEKPPRIALSPNAEVLAITVNSSVYLYETWTGSLYDTIDNIYCDGEYLEMINYLAFDPTGMHLFVAGSRAVRIFRNVCGYQASINTCIRLLGSRPSSATAERLKNSIKFYKESLNAVDN